MFINDQDKPKCFTKKILTIAIQLFFLTTFSHQAYATKSVPLDTTERYLDPSIWNITVEENECFKAAPNSLLQIEPKLSDKGYRVYQVTQIFDTKLQREIYSHSIEEQVKNHKVMGREFCGGIVSISNMDLPFTKTEKIADANDGILMAGKLREAYIDVSKQLTQMMQLAMQGSTGTYSSAQLHNIDSVFQAHLQEIEHIAEMRKFNGSPLLNSSMGYLDIPINGSLAFIRLPLTNLTIGSAGLNITELGLTSNANCQWSLGKLYDLIIVNTAFADLTAAEVRLKAVANADATITKVDVRTDNFIVQNQEYSLTTTHQ